MSHKHRVLVVVFIFVIATVLISACTQSLSSAPAGTPTVIPTGLFVSPFPSVENPMAMIEEFAKQTAAAQTTVANGGTPVAPAAISTGAPLTEQAGTAVPTTAVPSTPTNNVVVVATTAVVVVPTGPTPTAIPAGSRPPTYILQKDEFPFCIARRFNVDPAKLIYNQSALYYEGLVIQIPQNANSWPSSAGPIALRTHPDTYTVSGNADTTVYGVACKYGNVDPAAIVQANSGLSLSSKLTIGQKITIP